MNLVAVVGSPRKGKATDYLVGRAVEGWLSVRPQGKVEKIHLADYTIEHCKNCLACRSDLQTAPFAKCSIQDDMDRINPLLARADRFLFGTPVHMGFATGLMTVFLERICWTFSKPTGQFLYIRGIPQPRSSAKQPRAGIIVPSGVIPPLFRRFCDQATPLIRSTIRDTFNARTVGSVYAGAVEKRGAECYSTKAFELGKRLA